MAGDSTQNQALYALVFLYKHVLGQTMIYTHVLNRGGLAVASPADVL